MASTESEERSARPSVARGDRPRTLILILIALFLLRWWLATLPGYPADTQTYKRWALTGAQKGVHTLYDDPRTTYDYPPLYGYLLAPIGQIYEWISPAAAQSFGDSKTLSLLIKLPPQIFDILLAVLLALLATRHGLWPRGRAWAGWLPSLIYLFHPAVLVDSAYWGQPDAVHIFLVMLGLSLILLGKSEYGWIAAGLAVMMKPLAVPFLPLLAAATLVRSGWRRLFTGGAAGLATIVVVLLPFIVTGRLGLVLRRLVFDITLMPYSSINAHNSWWLLDPWGDARRGVLGPLSPIAIGQILFAVALLAILVQLYRIERSRAGRRPIGLGHAPLETQRHWYLAAGAVAFSFFMFSTVMHENHLLGALPFLLLMIPAGRPWRVIFVLTGLAIFINLILHDFHLGQRLFANIGGPSSFYLADFKRPLSWFEYLVSVGNTIGVMALYAAVMFFGWKTTSAKMLST